MIEVEIDAYSPKSVAEELNIKGSTFRALTAKVRAANIPGFDHEPYNPIPVSSAQIYRRIYQEKKKGFTWNNAIARTKQLIFTQLFEDLNNV